MNFNRWQQSLGTLLIWNRMLLWETLISPRLLEKSQGKCLTFRVEILTTTLRKSIGLSLDKRPLRKYRLTKLLSLSHIFQRWSQKSWNLSKNRKITSKINLAVSVKKHRTDRRLTFEITLLLLKKLMSNG